MQKSVRRHTTLELLRDTKHLANDLLELLHTGRVELWQALVARGTPASRRTLGPELTLSPVPSQSNVITGWQQSHKLNPLMHLS